jgi:hypothetical protein
MTGRDVVPENPARRMFQPPDRREREGRGAKPSPDVGAGRPAAVPAR